jgi:hypothetical protein
VGVVAERESALRGRAHFEPERFCIGLAPAPNERVQGSTWAVEKTLGPRPHPVIKVSSSMPIWPMLRIRRIYQIFDDMTLPRSSEWGVPRLGEKIHTWQRDVKY